MHGAFRVHNDIKKDNFILNQEQDKLQLIDFGISGRADVQSNKRKHYYFDIKSMGDNILPAIFPEILDRNSDIPHNETIAPLLAESIKTLYKTMPQTDPRLSCNCHNALLYCQQLLSNYETLNNEILKDITSRTICPSNKKVTDVLYEFTASENNTVECSIM